MKKKVFLIMIAMLLLVSTSVLGTLAYLTSQDSVVNTFTIGRIEITLDEADVDENGKLILDDEGNPAPRVKGNEYHLIPGRTYIKDPTITVKKDSEASYIRMMVTINCLRELDAVFAPEGADLTAIFGGYDPAIWSYAGEVRNETDNTITYEFRYKETVVGGTEDVALDALFDTFTLPGTITGDELENIQNMSITVTGHAIQAAGFADNAQTGETAEDAAWKAFDRQMKENP